MTYLNRGVVPEIVTLVLFPKGHVTIPATAGRTSPQGGTSFQARWQVIELWGVPAEPITSATNPGLIPWIPLMKTSVPPPVLLQQCREIIDTVADKTMYENLLVVTDVLAGLRYDKEVLSKFFRKGADMIESPVLEEYSERRAIRERQKVILEILADRFGSVPAEVASGIRTIGEETRLKILNKAAYTSTSLDLFQSILHATL